MLAPDVHAGLVRDSRRRQVDVGAPEDVTYLWEGIAAPLRVAANYLRPAAVSDGPQDRWIQPSTESGPAPAVSRNSNPINMA
jgi:hypothetical protein